MSGLYLSALVHLSSPMILLPLFPNTTCKHARTQHTHTTYTRNTQARIRSRHRRTNKNAFIHAHTRTHSHTHSPLVLLPLSCPAEPFLFSVHDASSICCDNAINRPTLYTPSPPQPTLPLQSRSAPACTLKQMAAVMFRQSGFTEMGVLPRLSVL